MAEKKSSVAETVVLGLIVVALLAAVFGGPEISPPGPVLLVGDSLMFQSGGDMTAALHEDGWEVHVVSTPGAGIAGGGFTPFNWASDLNKVTKQLDYEVAVVELGTNGCDGCRSIPQAIDEVMKNLHNVDVVFWIDARRNAPRPGTATADQINSDLRKATKRWDNLEVLSLEELLQHSSGSTLIEADGVHLTPAGQLVLTNSVRDVLRDKAGIDK